MNADELIRALAADAPPQASSLDRSIARAMMLGIVCALALFFATIGPRPGLASAIHDPRVRKLADGILATQVREIAEMKTLIADLERHPPPADAPRLPPVDAGQ